MALRDRIAQRHQKQREVLADATARAVLAQWAKVEPEKIAQSWARMLPAVTAMVQRGQLHGAQGTQTFMKEFLKTEYSDDHEIVPEQFAASAPDGRSLASLLSRAVPTALWRRGQGDSTPAAMASAGSFLDMVTRTVIADTGRLADQAYMVAHKGVTGYQRVVELPACARCIILAGRVYEHSEGFLRHPRCDCTMRPVTKKAPATLVDAKDVYDKMSSEQRKAVFGEAGAKAIEHGANVSTVVNARRAMDTVEMHGKKVQVTHVGTGPKKKPRRPPRLMPEEIFRQAETREDAIRLLYKNGYLR